MLNSTFNGKLKAAGCGETTKAADWKKENATAIAYSNEWVRRNGLPLESYRLF
jgi:post-segregation antitoxin (ccd killing protein)